MAYDAETMEVLAEAGWHPGRVIDVGDWCDRLRADGFGVCHEAAQQFMAELGGLSVDGSDRPGVTRYRERFELDPLLCLGESDRFDDWNERLGRSVYPVGELDGRYFLGLDEQSVLYIVIDWIGSFGPLPVALDRLVLGYASEPIAV
jgi:hypothetical protein